MSFHGIYRSTGKENRKPRPAFYSKALALFSFLRAVEELPQKPEIIFLNDAPVPHRLESVMASAGEVINVAGMGVVASYHRAIALPGDRRWSKDDLVYFSEDDYLYQPDAFVSLVAVFGAMPRPGYFAFYAARDGRDPTGNPVPARGVRVVERPGGPVHGAGHEWRPAMGTTSSFGARVGALRRDLWLHHLAHSSASAWDHVISIGIKGQHPFYWAEVVKPLRNARSMGRRDAVKLTLVRAALNAGAIAASIAWWHQLMAPTAYLATHMESPFLAAGVDWEAVAAETERWATMRGLVA